MTDRGKHIDRLFLAATFLAMLVCGTLITGKPFVSLFAAIFVVATGLLYRYRFGSHDY